MSNIINNTEYEITRMKLGNILGHTVRCKGIVKNVKFQARTWSYFLVHNISFRDEENKTYFYKHMWIGMNPKELMDRIEYNTEIEFDAVVEKYKEEEKYGLGKMSNIKVLAYPEETSFTKMNLGFDIDEIRYTREYCYAHKGEEMIAPTMAFCEDMGREYDELKDNSALRFSIKYQERLLNTKKSNGVVLTSLMVNEDENTVSKYNFEKNGYNSRQLPSFNPFERNCFVFNNKYEIYINKEDNYKAKFLFLYYCITNKNLHPTQNNVSETALEIA